MKRTALSCPRSLVSEGREKKNLQKAPFFSSSESLLEHHNLDPVNTNMSVLSDSSSLVLDPSSNAVSVSTLDALFSSLLVKPVFCCSCSQRRLNQGRRLCDGGRPLRSLCTPRGRCFSHTHQCVRTYLRLLQIPPQKIFPGSELHGFSKEESIKSSSKMMRHTQSRRLLLCTMFVQSDSI